MYFSKMLYRTSSKFEEDKVLLVELVEENKLVIECKKTDSISNKTKNETWEKITKVYNSRRNGGEKTSHQLKTAFKNLKGKVRKEVANDRTEIYKTGGGVSNIKLNDNPLMSIVAKSVTPNKNYYDSSRDIFGDKVC